MMMRGGILPFEFPDCYNRMEMDLMERETPDLPPGTSLVMEKLMDAGGHCAG